MPKRPSDSNAREPFVRHWSSGITPEDMPAWGQVVEDPYLLFLQLMMVSTEPPAKSVSKVDPLAMHHSLFVQIQRRFVERDASFPEKISRLGQFPFSHAGFIRDLHTRYPSKGPLSESGFPLT